MTAENHYNQMFKICQMIRTGLKSPGVVEIRPGIEVTMSWVKNGHYLYIENPHVDKFFPYLDDMEKYVLGEIHALRMLQGIKARRASGIITESENN